MIPGGKIIGPTPNLVNPSNVVAEKVANIAAPASANTMWDKLSRTPGLSTAPKMSGGMTSMSPGTYGTSRLQQMSNQLADNDRYKLKLPNIEGKPKQGIGSAMQEVDGGMGSGKNKGNTVFVDDKNWPVTLKELVGSRILTPQQLEAASIQNVKKLFNVGLDSTKHQGSRSVGSKDENEELYYMAQRMMIEGFVRGVDITKELKKQGGINIAIRDISYTKNAARNLGLSTTSGGIDSVNFNAKFWRGANEAEKYTLFMHELGHNLLNRPELGSEATDDIMGPGPRVIAKRLMSSKGTYNAILNDHFGSATNKGTIAIAKLSSGQGTDKFDPSWFPQLSGEQVSIGGGTYTPGESGSEPSKDYTGDFKGINDNFDRLSKMIETQNQTMQQFQQQEAINSVDTNAPSSSVGQAQLNSPQMTQMSGGGFGQGAGSIDTTGFAQQLANLGSSDGQSAGNLLSSG